MKSTPRTSIAAAAATYAAAILLTLLTSCSWEDQGSPVDGGGEEAGSNRNGALSVSPAQTECEVGRQVTLQADYADDPGARFAWRIVSGTGSVNDQGIFQAPLSLPVRSLTSIIQVSLQSDTAKRVFAKVVVTTQHPVPDTGNGGSQTGALRIEPEIAEIYRGEIQDFVLRDANGAAVAGAVWSVDQGRGGIDPSGRFTAPTSMSAPQESSTIVAAYEGGNYLARVTYFNSAPDEVCFTREILPLLRSNCAMSGCHDAATAEDDVDLTDYNSLMNSDGIVRPGRGSKSELYEVLVEKDLDDRMPPAGREPLTSEQIALIKRWIDEGAQESDCPDPNGPQCETENVGYSSHVVQILETNCIGCHSGSNPSGGLDFRSAQVVQQAALDGRIAGAIQRQPGFSPMPPVAALSDCDVDKLLAWINGGAAID